MVKNDKEEGGSEYDYILPLAIVLISWGIVPAFAKIGNLPGDVTTLYVNLFATLALVLWVTIEKKWRLFNAYSPLQKNQIKIFKVLQNYKINLIGVFSPVNTLSRLFSVR